MKVLQRVAISKVDLFYGEMPVFTYNSETDRYEHIWANGNRILFYSRSLVEDEAEDDWIVFYVDKEKQIYERLQGGFK